MIQHGDKVLWLKHNMPGTVTGFVLGDPVIQWESGYPSDISGGTYSAPLAWIGTLILVEGENGSKPKAPETLMDPRGRDLFEEAFQLSFEI